MKRLFLSACLLTAISAVSAETKLTPDAQAKLDANGLVVVDQPLRQGFSAYLGGEHPLFITNDSLLMAYHRIFEEMVGEIEAGQLAFFRDFTRDLWKKLPADAGKDADDDAKEGFRRARLIWATATRLLTGSLPEGLSQAETAAVTAEVERVEKGEGTFAPPWILSDPKPEDHVSYAAFQPGGLFEGRESLERYYRFRKWLQEMQVDPGDQSTLSALACFGIALDNMSLGFRNPLEEPFAPGDFERGILNRLPEISGNFGNRSIREGRIGIPSDVQAATRVRLFGVLHPGGSKITRALVERSHQQQSPVAVGFTLGNSFAGTLLEPAQQEAATKSEDFSLNQDRDLRSILCYYGALRALNAPADERAPALFRSQPWQRKQLNATLGSWTEYRYALLLGSREDAHWFGMTLQEPGFVEPTPGFYRELGESAEDLAVLLASYRSERSLQISWIVRLKDLAILLRKIEAVGGSDKPEAAGSEWQVSPYYPLISAIRPKLPPGSFYSYPPIHTADSESCGTCAGLIEKFAESWWAGDPEAREQLRSYLAKQPDLVGPRLSRLAGICFRLEAMAERQLAKRPWTDADKEFFNDYGKTLGWLMFYEGNSYLTPRDDAPRIVRYASDTGLGSSRIFHAATSQPRLLLIHYPNPAGEEILCQGAVYAYRDVECDHTPPKQEWQAEAKTSAWPEWMKPVVGSCEPPAGKEEE